MSSLGNGLSISSSEEGRGCPVPIWTTRIQENQKYPTEKLSNCKNRFYTKQTVCNYQVYSILPVGLWEGLVHKGFPAPSAVRWQLYTDNHKNRQKARFYSYHTGKWWNYITLLTVVTHKPDMRLLICAWTEPFSKLWTTVLAILVRCPMYPLLMPPADLYTEVRHSGKPLFCNLFKNSIQNYLGD